MKGATAAAFSAALLLAGCGLVGGGGRTHEVSFSTDGTVTINGTPNEATADKLEAGRLATPAGDFVVWTYPSQVGGCYDVVFPNGERAAGCQVASGVDASKPVTGHGGGGSAYAINPAAFNYGSAAGAPIGMIHHGIAHPTVAQVRIVPAGGGEPLSVVPFDAPNVEGLRVFVIAAPEGVDDYRLEALDGHGCVLSAQPTSVSVRPSEQPEKSVTRSC